MNFHSGVRTARAAFQVASLNMITSRCSGTSPRMSGISERPSSPSASGRPSTSSTVGSTSTSATMAEVSKAGTRPGAHRMSGTWVTES